MQNIDRKYGVSYAEAKDYAFTLVKTRVIEKLEKEEKPN